MVKKLISRKRFLSKALTGIAGIGLVNKTLDNEYSTVPVMRNIGATGISITPVGFGASRTNEESLIRYAVGKGINFIDTGRSYSNGNNERLVGRAIAGIRKTIVIQSKIRLDPFELPSMGKGKKGAEEIKNILYPRLEASLKALNTDYIDVLLYHDARNEGLLFHPETMKFFSDQKQAGTIKACGFSTHNDRMNLVSRNNTEKFYDSIMVPFNHKGSFVHSVTKDYSEWDQERLIGILEEAREKGIGVIAMKTCSGGTYSPSPGVGPGFPEAVKWVLHHNYISGAAVAISNFEQADDYLACLAMM
jgi:aryl-alcohol dehydrogenase-like predicted oxidoreductase